MSSLDLISPQSDPSQPPARPRRGGDLSARLKELMADSETMTKTPEPSTRPTMSGGEVVAQAVKYAALASNPRVAERQAREDYERKQQPVKEPAKPKRSRDEVAAELRSWLGDLSAAQREAWLMGEQFDRLSPRVKELALEVLHELDADEPEPTADWLTGLLDDEDEDEDEDED